MYAVFKNILLGKGLKEKKEITEPFITVPKLHKITEAVDKDKWRRRLEKDPAFTLVGRKKERDSCHHIIL